MHYVLGQKLEYKKIIKKTNIYILIHIHFFLASTFVFLLLFFTIVYGISAVNSGVYNR